MTRKSIRNILVLSMAALFSLALFGGCGGPYIPTVQDGTCKDGRVWVAPAQDAEGNWKEGYCRDQ
jgi:hypothetical protein